MKDALQAIALATLGVSLAVNAFFLRRVLAKVDLVYVWIVGTPVEPGIAPRVRNLEDAVYRDRDAPLNPQTATGQTFGPLDVGRMKP